MGQSLDCSVKCSKPCGACQENEHVFPCVNVAELATSESLEHSKPKAPLPPVCIRGEPSASWVPAIGSTASPPRDPKAVDSPLAANGNGMVTLRRPGDKHYDGQTIEGRKHGQGTLLLGDGSKYVGQFRDNVKHGHGTYSYPNGSVYVGEWADDQQHGTGTEYWSDGSTFEGQFCQGRKHGSGRFLWGNGCIYEGEFLDNEMHGCGCYRWTDGKTYDGQWIRNNMGSTGSMKWPDGRMYEGEFKDGKKHGEGSHWWPDGRCYRGQWCNGKQHNQGIARTAKGVECKGLWTHGQFVKWLTSEPNGATAGENGACVKSNKTDSAAAEPAPSLLTVPAVEPGAGALSRAGSGLTVGTASSRESARTAATELTVIRSENGGDQKEERLTVKVGKKVSLLIEDKASLAELAAAS
eukprot:TRINITY_DN122627_c0_g1_i1.p1 TRINITY_DN122627_c0_g1~~TRINITY_DN122627_c0_g1_i1.p1  ORF type:complete len:444 (+),score=64.59 TRINITY_DN122627_c0_g1_i1:106-1332(+)